MTEFFLEAYDLIAKIKKLRWIGIATNGSLIKETERPREFLIWSGGGVRQ